MGRLDKYKLGGADGHTPEAVDDFLEWAQWFEISDDVRRVAYLDFGDGELSTVFLCIDHNWAGGGPPVLFETMLFVRGKGAARWRWRTWNEAAEMHRIIASIIERGLAAGHKLGEIAAEVADLGRAAIVDDSLKTDPKEPF